MRSGFARKGLEWVGGQPLDELRVLLHQASVLQRQFFGGGLLTLELFVNFLDRVEVVLGVEQFAALDAERLGDDERLFVDPVVEVQQGFQFVRRQEVPIHDGLAFGAQMRMGVQQPLLDVGTAAAVHAADALHKADGIPVQVEVDEPVGVLKVQPLGKDVRGDEDVDGLVGRRGAVVERGEPADDRAPLVWRTGAVDAFEAVQPFGAQVRFQVGRGVRKLGEDDDFTGRPRPCRSATAWRAR